MEMTKTRPIPKNAQCQQYEQLINSIPESMKKSESNNKQKVLRLFESKIDHTTSVGCKPKKITDAYEGKYFEYKIEKSSMNQ